MGRTFAMTAVEEGRPSRSPGDRGLAMIGAAKRDPEALDRPRDFDIGRSPNRRVTFGCGMNFCIGARLPRPDGKIAFSRLIGRVPDMRLPEEAPEWRRTIIMDGPRRLPDRMS